MKNIILLLIVFLSMLLSCSKKETNYYGIINASILNSRINPSISSKIIGNFTFGTPVVLLKKSDNKENINGINDFWYLEKYSNSWLFGGYLIIIHNESLENEDIGLFESNGINCNVPTGGITSDKDLKINYSYNNTIFFKGYYIHPIIINQYPKDENDDLHAIIIGVYKIMKNKIHLADKFYCIYNSNGIFKRIDIAETNREQEFEKFNDDYGIYYINRNHIINIDLKLPRREINKKCNPNESFGFYYSEFKPTNYQNIKNKFPLMVKKP